MRRKLGARPHFGKAANATKPGIRRYGFLNRKLAPQNKKPGLAARAFQEESTCPQAAGLNSFEALFLIGSTASLATFWDNSASSLLWAVSASNCFLA
jgi:hypothetical protein